MSKVVKCPHCGVEVVVFGGRLVKEEVDKAKSQGKNIVILGGCRRNDWSDRYPCPKCKGEMGV
jgi:hypothetical protein